jgi:hypothetical protein
MPPSDDYLGRFIEHLDTIGKQFGAGGAIARVGFGVDVSNGAPIRRSRRIRGLLEHLRIESGSREPVSDAARVMGKNSSKWILFFFGLCPHQEWAQLADIEAGIGFTCPRKGDPAISDSPFQHPLDRGLQVSRRPDPVYFPLFCLAGGIATTAHGRDVRLL